MFTRLKFYKAVSFCTITLIAITELAACSNGTTTAASEISSLPTSSTYSSALPANLFDSTAGTNTVAGASAVNTGTYSSTPLTYTQQQCLGNSNVFFNGLGSVSGGATSVNNSTGCYGSAFSANDFYEAGLNTLGGASNCLSAIIAAMPQTSDPNAIAYAFNVGAMAVSRCVASMNQGMQSFPAQWNSLQSNIFSGNNSGLFNTIQSFQPLNTTGNYSSVYPGAGFSAFAAH